GGTRLLRERPDLMGALKNQERLRALPAGTLGRTYAEFVSREGLAADGLVEASERMTEPDPSVPEERYWFGARLRDMHDLWHVVTGYSRDILGELALLAFTYEQTREPGIGYIVRNVERRIRKGDDGEVSEFLREASARGRDATLLPAADWESLLERPLEEVREQLRLGPPPEYEQRRTPSGETAVAAAGA
ncbi:MAG: Coq4 family protein, partial [Myxococcota bacterium]